jgi:hypothetical protein
LLKALHQEGNKLMNHIQLSIPTACHEDWNKMTQVEKGKFCSSCQKVVVDFTNMSDAEIIAYFKKPKDSVCGRFYDDQLNREINVPPKRIPWLKYFFQIAIPAFLMSFKVSGQTKQLQGRVMPKLCVIPDSTLSNTKITKPALENALQGRAGGVVIQKSNSGKTATMAGKITDENGMPIAFASVFIKGTQIGTHADSTGNFSICVNEGQSTLLVTAVGYSAKEVSVNTTNPTNVVLVSLNQAWMGELVIVKHTKRSKKKQKVNEIQQLHHTKDVKIYPNPASSGSDITLDWKETIEGSYEMQFISEAGIVVSKIEIEAVLKSSKTNIQLPWLPKGLYIVSITNKKIKAQYTGKLLIN